MIVEMTDDIDGKPAAETLVFGVDGREFEIDLSEKNAAKLRKAMDPWIVSAAGPASSWPRNDGREQWSRHGRGPGLGRKQWGRGIDPRPALADVIEQYRAAGN